MGATTTAGSLQRFVLGFHDVDRAVVGVVGGKGAHLGELSQVDGIRVPPGFCVTVDAFERAMADVPSFEARLDGLGRLGSDDRETIPTISAEIRRAIEQTPIPDEVALQITGALDGLGDDHAYAVRSSATAEDLPTASFAGQQDTYLNVVGTAAVLEHVRRCWASLFTERAAAYRVRNGFDHRKVQMAVVVQRMVFPDAAGVLFTADPVTSNRKVASVEAVFGLGEALVSGRMNPDVYTVGDDRIVSRTIATKDVAVNATPGGGTHERVLDPGDRQRPVLTDERVLELTQLGRRIEAHFDRPQDIEWCQTGEDFHIVQSRPITTLFPIPEVGDSGNHVYISVGHGQMMTDPMKPLGLSVWQLTALPPMFEAGGRLFVDVTMALASPASRAGLLDVIGRSDPLMRDALETVLERGDFVPSLPDQALPNPAGGGPPPPIVNDPEIVAGLIERSRTSIDTLERSIEARSGTAVFGAILEDIQELKLGLIDPVNRQAVMAGMEATWWLNDHLQEWLGEKNAADTLSLSVPNNVTSEMGLALLDVADVIRPHRAVVDFLSQVEDADFLDRMAELPGGRKARQAILGYLDHYGMRCVGEIDITRPRWSERPGTLLPVLLGNIDRFEPGTASQRFERGRREAEDKEREVLERLRALPDRELEAEEVKRMIDRVRTFIGYREYPKYDIVSRYFVYKKALLAEADRLVQSGVIDHREDIFYLSFEELRHAVDTNQVDHRLIQQRQRDFETYQGMTPPRVLTSNGEAVAGVYRRQGVPDGALVGLGVSAGIVEGRARVVLDMAGADLEEGDILVTTHTDPSWSPLFVSIAGLVTEVGGLMTHGAVVAREYGLPAVVGVARATHSIRDGQRIRVHGTEGYVEIAE